jgi:hypothetical protein
VPASYGFRPEDRSAWRDVLRPCRKPLDVQTRGPEPRHHSRGT